MLWPRTSSIGFGGTVIQVVVHLIATGSEMLSRFGGTVIQLVVYQSTPEGCIATRFGGTVNQAVVHPEA